MLVQLTTFYIPVLNESDCIFHLHLFWVTLYYVSQHVRSVDYSQIPRNGAVTGVFVFAASSSVLSREALFASSAFCVPVVYLISHGFARFNIVLLKDRV